MTARKLVALAATVVLFALPLGQTFLDAGHVDDALVGALLVLALGGAGRLGDEVLRDRLRAFIGYEEDEADRPASGEDTES